MGKDKYFAFPILEVKQMAGRAGRPQYDEFGEAILLARYEEDISELLPGTEIIIHVEPREPDD